jgi:hypothetical protein
MNKRVTGFSRRGPDHVAEELVSVLSVSEWFEFKPLFLLVFANLRARHFAGGGEELLRLRVYEKLQQLVFKGVVEKDAKKYRGVPASVSAFKEQVAAEHCRGLMTAVAVPATTSPSRGTRAGKSANGVPSRAK